MYIAVVPTVLIGGMLIGVLHLSGLLSTDATCKPGECPVIIHASDEGKTFTYTPASRFSIYLDDRKYPHDELRCEPSGVIGTIPAPHGKGPMYAAAFKAVAPGVCRLMAGDFWANIVVQ